MKILWFCPRHIIGLFNDNKPKSSGSWLDAAYSGCKDSIEVCVVSVSGGNVLRRENDGKNIHFLIPGILPRTASSKIKFNSYWSKIKSEFDPDIVHIWGTELEYAKYVQDFFSAKPSVVYMQGVINKVHRDYLTGFSFKDVLFNTTFNDIIHRNGLLFIRRRFAKQQNTEKLILQNATAVIIENDWCSHQVSSIAPNCKQYRSLLPIKKDFFEHSWDITNVKRHKLFTNAGGAIFKGHKYLFDALKIVLCKYPDTILYIPGAPDLKEHNTSKINGYQKLLGKYMRKLNISDNVVFTGALSSNQMAGYMAKCNAYIMPSVVENHSSSLIEGLIVGAPCISSFVGGTANVAKHAINAFLYNYSDPESLAGYIIDIFDNDDLACQLSCEAKKVREERMSSISDDLINIYSDILCK